jgi:hypothetical protein
VNFGELKQVNYGFVNGSQFDCKYDFSVIESIDALSMPCLIRDSRAPFYSRPDYIGGTSFPLSPILSTPGQGSGQQNDKS